MPNEFRTIRDEYEAISYLAERKLFAEIVFTPDRQEISACMKERLNRSEGPLMPFGERWDKVGHGFSIS